MFFVGQLQNEAKALNDLNTNNSKVGMIEKQNKTLHSTTNEYTSQKLYQSQGITPEPN